MITKKTKENYSTGNERMDYLEILKIIANSAGNRETVEIYYPETRNSPEGWREIEPYSLTDDIGDSKETLIYDQDRLSPGHILNAYTVGNKSDHCNYFIIGKIKKARLTNRKFKPRNDWKINF